MYVLRPAGSSFTSLRKAPHSPESGFVLEDFVSMLLAAVGIGEDAGVR